MIRKFILFTFILSIIINLAWSCQDQPPLSQNDLYGYWRGSLPANPAIIVVLYFHEENDKPAGKVFFTEGEAVNNEEAVRSIYFDGRKIEFDIPSQGTHYSGKISPAEIDGGFVTPGNPFLELKFTKTRAEDLPSAAALKNVLKPYDLDQTFRLEQLKEDFSLLKETLAAHPQAYFYHSKDEFDSYFQDAEKQLYDGMKASDFIRFAAPLIAYLKCCHTRLVLPEKIRKAIISQSKSIPLDIIYLDDKAYVRKSLTGTPSIESGSEILAINGMSAKKILRKLSMFVSADADNMSAKTAEINKNFWMLYHYIESPAEFSLKIKDPSAAKVTEIQIVAVPSAEIVKALAEVRTAKHKQAPNSLPVSLSIDNDAAVLSVSSFYCPEMDKYIKKLADLFKEIKDQKIKNLIIDLRGNMGGHPELSSELFSYLISKPAAYFKEPRNFKPYAALLKPLKPKENRFRGSTYFLADGGCRSSTGHFLALVKYHKLGKIIGAVPGASFTCNDESRLINLPNSKLQFSAAQTTFTAAVNGWKRGDQIIPDILVKPEIEDIISGKDTVMEFVKDLIVKK